MDANRTDQAIDPVTGLGLRDRDFVDRVISDPKHNQTKAYIESGYTLGPNDSARRRAADCLNSPDVQAYYQERVKDRAARFEKDGDRVILELVIIAYSDVSDFVVNPETGAVDVRPGVPREMLRAISGLDTTVVVKQRRDRGGATVKETTYRVKPRLWDKMKAVDLLCKHLGLIQDRLPDLEVLLNRLPPWAANILRTILSSPPAAIQALPAVPAPEPEGAPA